MAHWLLIERLQNWRIDREEGFVRFGIPASKAPLAETVRAGDVLIFYVSSGISAFSHVREAAADGLRKLGLAGEYDVGFPFTLSTTPSLILPRRDWVPIQRLQDRLSFTRGRNLRVAMRTSIMKLRDEDARIILDEMRAAQGPA